MLDLLNIGISKALPTEKKMGTPSQHLMEYGPRPKISYQSSMSFFIYHHYMTTFKDEKLVLIMWPTGKQTWQHLKISEFERGITLALQI